MIKINELLYARSVADGWVYADDTSQKRVDEKAKREHEWVGEERMTEAEEDLSSHYQVQESRVILHPANLEPVLLTRYGWAKRQGFFGERVRWYKQEVTEIKEKNT